MILIDPCTRRGDVTFHSDGRIDLTAYVTDCLAIGAGDVIGIAESDDAPKEYYIYVARRAADVLGRHRCACRPAHGNGRYMRLFSRRLAAYMLQRAHATLQARLTVGETVTLPGIGRALTLIVKSCNK